MKNEQFSSKAISINYTCLNFFFIFLLVLWGAYLFLEGHILKGPAIFGDELAYFNFARSLFLDGNTSQHTQYGPLYPFIISFFFYLKEVNETYQLARLFNILIFISASIPAYLLGHYLFTHNGLRALLPLCVLICPFSGLVHLIWAEPLYITLLYWNCLLLYLFTKKPTLLKCLLLGILLSSLYYAKPGSGLITQIAGCLTLAFYSITSRHSSVKPNILSLITIATCVLLITPWALHYLRLGCSIIGYPSATKSLNWRITHEGYGPLVFDTFRGLFYQFSYCTIASWGLIGICFYLFWVRWKELSKEEHSLILFIILSCIGLIALSAFGIASYQMNYKIPQGRYFSPLLPIIVGLTLHLIFKSTIQSKQKKNLLLVIVLTTTIAMIASPLYVQHPLAFNSMPELSLFIYIRDKGAIIWRCLLTTPPLLWRIGVPLFFGLFASFACFSNKRPYCLELIITLIACGMISSALIENRYITQSSFSELHDIYFYLSKNHINPSKVAFDKNMDVYFVTKFWTNTSPRYLTKEEVIHTYQPVSYFVTRDTLNMKKMLFSTAPSGDYKIYALE